VLVAIKIPASVVCLISALAFHDMTTQVPHAVDISLPRGSEPPRLDHPPTRHYWFTGKAMTEGIETHTLDKTPVRIYSPEKTLADCFKYRNKIGLDIAIEALRLYLQHKRFQVDKITHYAAICRVNKVMRPYLEAML
jgi:predicted transcriptional regulator of viral defense system